jgi:LPS sulfotransferase NodH
VHARPRGYLLCATPRSGSNYLCELLASTGRLGTPREYFNATGRRAYDDPAYPEDPREELARVLTTGSTTNGVYGVKVHPFQLAPLLDRVDPFAELPRLRAVRIRRLDRLGQALSWARAQQTGQFRAGDRAWGGLRTPGTSSTGRGSSSTRRTPPGRGCWGDCPCSS